MTVFVDPPVNPFRGMLMCHMWADELDELHAMADRLGLRRAWFQEPPKASWHHYDVSKGLHRQAVALGAVETDKFGPIEFLARRDGNIRRLEFIARARALRASPQGRLGFDLARAGP